MSFDNQNIITLLVSVLPNNNLAYTNEVYVHPSTLSKLNTPTFIKVGNSIYSVKAHEDVGTKRISLNGLQRRTTQVTLNQSLSISVYNPSHRIGLSAISLNIDLLVKKTGGQPLKVEATELRKCFSITYGMQIFSVGQIMGMNFGGMKLEITVTHIDNGDEVDSYGQLLDETFVTFEKKKGSVISLEGAGASNLFTEDFDFAKLGIGGLDKEFNQIFRRAFASRIWPSHIVQSMGINHVRGMLLYGPPGCGKTLIARQIGKALNARDPKIVNGPEILDKYVGGSEEKIRELFAEATKEQALSGDDSMLHIIILDEMDAICKSRGTVKDSTGVTDSVVNQLLSMIDGVDSLNNILLIGMTNRLDMIDDALLRPGRLEVHVEIGLPDEVGRSQILTIHTKKMFDAGRVNPEVKTRINEVAALSKNFSGAELEGLVKSASSFALARAVDVNDLSKAPRIEDLEVQFSDFERALAEVEPKFGVNNTELESLYRGGIINYGESFTQLQNTMGRIIEQVRTSDKTPLLSVLLEGDKQSGKTAFAAHTAVQSGYPFIRMISAESMIGYSESSKCQEIHKAFMDSYKSPLSLIFLDDIERLIDYVPVGPRFSNSVLQTLLVLLNKPPPDKNRKLLIFATTSVAEFLWDLGLSQSFSISQHIPLLDPGLSHPIEKVLMDYGSVANQDEARQISKLITKHIGIKRLLTIVEMAMSNNVHESESIVPNIFLESLQTVGY
jgi:vesicle-fusing ATPase